MRGQNRAQPAGVKGERGRDVKRSLPCGSSVPRAQAKGATTPTSSNPWPNHLLPDAGGFAAQVKEGEMANKSWGCKHAALACYEATCKPLS